MSDNPNDNLPLESEIDALKARADVLGVKYHPSIGVDKLKEKIEEAMADSDNDTPSTEAAAPAVSETDEQRLRREATRLVQVRVTCMNPNKKEWEGEIFCVGNSIVGTLKKFVPFGVEWHVPAMMLEMIQNRKCQVFQTVTNKNTGKKERKGKLIKEFAVEVLPDMTEQELKDLAQRQAMANGTAAA